MEIPLTTTKNSDLQFTVSPFPSYKEARIYAISLMEQQFGIMDISIIKRKLDPIWAIQYRISSLDFFDKYIIGLSGEE